jgi:hypothetical protein
MRHHPQRVEKLSEGRTLPEESEGNLRVWQLPQGLEKFTRLVDSFLRMRVAEIRRPNGATQQLEVALVAKENNDRFDVELVLATRTTSHLEVLNSRPMLRAASLSQ